MNEKNLTTVLEALAETIQRLRLDISLLQYENERLKDKIAVYESPVQEVSNGKL
jgi:FtsZ-binding cell division protein ZapB